MNTSAYRVASRYQFSLRHEEPSAVDLLMTDGVTLAASDIQRVFEPHAGRLHRVGIRYAPHEAPTGFLWDGVDERGEPVGGRMDLRVLTDLSRVRIRMELLLDCDDGTRIRCATVQPRQLLDDRLREIASQARRIIDRVRVQPQVPAQAIVDDLERLLAIAEGE